MGLESLAYRPQAHPLLHPLLVLAHLSLQAPLEVLQLLQLVAKRDQRALCVVQLCSLSISTNKRADRHTVDRN